MNRPKCQPLVGTCPSLPLWKMRSPGDSMERNWTFACGRHLNQIASDQAFDSGMKMDLVRVKGDE